MSQDDGPGSFGIGSLGGLFRADASEEADGHESTKSC